MVLQLAFVFPSLRLGILVLSGMLKREEEEDVNNDDDDELVNNRMLLLLRVNAKLFGSSGDNTKR
jgi:hypothetical protein